MKKLLFILMAALVLCGSASAQTKKKAPRKQVVEKTAFDPEQFTGTYENSYSDNLGGMVTDYVSLQYTKDGEVYGVMKNESGDVTNICGVIENEHLKAIDVLDSENTFEMYFYDITTLKIIGFTGTFKRTSNEYTEFEAEEKEVEVVKPETIEDAADRIRKVTAGATPFPND